MLIILYNCRFDWMPGLSTCRDPQGYVHACKQEADQLSKF
jgi:hypothetical protein